MVKAAQQNAKNSAFRLTVVAQKQKRKVKIGGKNMKEQGITQVQELLNKLKTYPIKMRISLFNEDNTPITLVREQKTKDNKIHQWITFCTNGQVKVRTIEDLTNLLKQCPKEMIITVKDIDNKYSKIYLGKEGIKGESEKWLVICDKNSYEKYYLEKKDILNELKIKAHEKMRIEMSKSDNSTEKKIHNWISNQNNEKLFIGILKNDRTIKDSIQYCLLKVKEIYPKENGIMIDDDTVFSWIEEYFILEKIQSSNIKGNVITNISTKQSVKKSTNKGEKEQINLFDIA